MDIVHACIRSTRLLCTPSLWQDAGIARLHTCRSPLTSLNVSYGGQWLTGSTLGLLPGGAATLRELHVGSFGFAQEERREGHKSCIIYR